MNATLNNNSVSNNDGNGVRGIVRASAATLRLKTQNNTVTAPLLANRNGIRVDSGSASGRHHPLPEHERQHERGQRRQPGPRPAQAGHGRRTNEFAVHNLAPSPATAAQTAAFVAAANPAGGRAWTS